MASTEYRSPARPEPPRQRLTSPWTLLGIAVAVGVTLVLIFPGRGWLSSREGAGTQTKLTKEAVRQGAPSDVSLTYLENLAAKEPNNPELRFTLAQKQVEAGRVKEGRAALEPLYNSPDAKVRQRARMMDAKLQLQQVYALPPGSTEREAANERLRQELAAMNQYEWDNPGLVELADLASKAGARKVRSDIYQRLARSDTKASRKWMDESARDLLADGEYRGAAGIYFTAQKRSSSVADQRYYFISGLKALQAGNLNREALAAADANAGSLLGDDETLRYLIGLARATNDTRRAQAYVRRLMRMSAIGPFERWARAAADFLIPSAAAAAAPAEPPQTRSPAKVMAGMRPFNQQDYQLAYDVFLSNRNLDDAYRVAAAAVQQRPNDMGWRERLAQISEWSGREEEALQQWLYIARRTGSPAAWTSIMRLGPGLFDDEALLEAMRYQATRRTLTDEQWRAVADAYERVGRPREGVAYLESQYAKNPKPIFLELEAYLLERTGDLDAAITANQRLIERAGATTKRVSNLATLLIVRGNYKEAYDLLESYRPNVAQEDTEYWKLLADLAWQLQEGQGAERALDTLVASGKAVPEDFNRLLALLQPTRPELAARLAELGYDRFRTTDYLIAALGIYSDRRDFISMRRVFQKITPEVEVDLEKLPDYLMLRAEYRAATGSPDLALKDYRQALKIDPNHRFARIGLLWFLIDRRDIKELEREMPATIAAARNDESYDGPLGAAYLTLGESQRAVEFFARVLKRNKDDYLWLLNYADALEQNNQEDMAWRVRRHAWLKVREEMAKREQYDETQQLELIQAQARVAASLFPGDRGMAVMRALLRQDKALQAEANDPMRRGIDTGTRELALSYLISTESWVAAKAWLWKQYARNLAKPIWGETSIALAENDLDKLQKLLDTRADAMPRYDRHEAAERTQAYRLAQDVAFTELARRPYDDEIHLRLTTSVLQTNNSWEVGETWFTRGVVRGHETTGEVAVWLSPRLRLSADVTYIDQHLGSLGVLAYVPQRDVTYGLTALFRHRIGTTRVSVFQRNALGELTGARISYGRPLGPRITGNIGLAYNDRADETSSLLVGGVRDRAFVNAEYVLAKREYVLGELSASRYYTQDRTFIGSGQQLSWEAGHRFRTEYPDFHVRLAGSFNRFNRSGVGDQMTAVLNPDGTIPTAAFFLPDDFTVYGIYTGFGTFYQTNYTRAIRPFVDVGISHNTVTGQGYGAILGASGSVLGADRLTVYASTGRGGNGTNELSREIGLRYMYMFDRF